VGEWQHAKIGDLCQIIKGETGLASALPGEYPLVATGADRRSCASWQFDTEAVCIPLVSSTGHGKKTLNYVHYQSGKFALGTILAAVIPKDPSVLTARFLHLYLSHFKDTVLVPLMKGAANVSLPMKAIASVEIPVPPLEEQQNLIDLIFRIEDEHGALLSETNRQGDLFKQLRQAVLQEAVEGKLTTAWRKQHSLVKGDPQHDAAALLAQIKAEKERLVREGKIRQEKPLPPIADDVKPFDLPDGWGWCRLGNVFSVENGDRSSNYPVESDFVFNGIPFINTKSLVDGSVNLEFDSLNFITESKFASLRSGKLRHNDLLLVLRGSVGKSGIFKSTDKYFTGFINAQLMILRSAELNADFYNLLLKTNLFLSQAIERSSGSAQPQISAENVKKCFLVVPPLAEQQAIVARVDSLITLIDELEKQVAERKEQAQLLMQTVLREAFDQEEAIDTE
jgi:type I restriction enzyme, S subunit